jgi:hypothetical protein
VTLKADTGVGFLSLASIERRWLSLTIRIEMPDPSRLCLRRVEVLAFSTPPAYLRARASL